MTTSAPTHPPAPTVLLGSTVVAAPAQVVGAVTSAAAHRHAAARTGGQP